MQLLLLLWQLALRWRGRLSCTPLLRVLLYLWLVRLLMLLLLLLLLLRRQHSWQRSSGRCRCLLLRQRFQRVPIWVLQALQQALAQHTAQSTASFGV